MKDMLNEKSSINEGLEKWLPLIAMERAGLRVLTTAELKKQLAGKKDSAAIMFFDWHHKGGEMTFPTKLKIIDLDNYILHLKHPMSSFSEAPKPNLKGAKMLLFETEGLPVFGRKYSGDLTPEKKSKSLPLPKHLTVSDFKKAISKVGDKSFFAVKHHGEDYVSPDLLMNYNIETYPLTDSKGNLVGANLKNGDVQTFGLGSTMSTDWGPFSFYLESKKIFSDKKENLSEEKLRAYIRKTLI